MATSHKRETARRKPRAAAIAGPLAVLATGAAIGIGVLGSGSGALSAIDQTAAQTSISSAGSADPGITRSELPLSRDFDRSSAGRLSAAEELIQPAAVRKAVAAADTKRWARSTLNLWTRPDRAARKVGELDEGTMVLITGRAYRDRMEVVVDGKSRWISKGYLADEKPLGAGAGLSMEPCPDSGEERGLTANAVRVYRSVCNAFPQITSYGGWDNHGEHTSGRAIDIMTSDVPLGTAIAEFLRAHASELNLYAVIWRQHIWTPVRSSEGWRFMPSRGSATANHYDHVHVSTY